MWQEKKIPKPKLSYEKLNLASQNLFDIVSVVYGKNSSGAFTIDCKHLAESLHSYAEQLNKAKLRMEKLRSTESTERSDNFVLLNIALARDKFSDEYKLLDDQLLNFAYFEPIFIQNNVIKVPENRKDWYKWYENLKISHR